MTSSPSIRANPVKKIVLETGVHYSTVSKLCSQLHSALPKAQGGWPSKLNSTTICHAIWIISTGRADTATQVTKSLQETLPESVCHGMTSLPPLCLPLAASDHLCLHSTSSASTPPPLPPLHFFHLCSAPTPMCTCTAHTTTLCPLSD